MKRKIKRTIMLLFLTMCMCLSLGVCAQAAKNTKHKHNYKSVKVNATCTKDGYTAKKCSCGAIKDKKTIRAKGHNFKLYKKKASTCTKRGYKTDKCSKCGAIKNVELPLGPHKWSAWYNTNRKKYVIGSGFRVVQERFCRVCKSKQTQT